MGFIRSLVYAVRATAVASAMAAQSAKYSEIVRLIDESVAKLRATTEAIFARRASYLNIPDVAARVAREPDVIAAVNAVDGYASAPSTPSYPLIPMTN